MSRNRTLSAFFAVAAAAAAQVAAQSSPGDLAGRWTALFAGGPMAGQRAADLAIDLGPKGPVVDLTLYKYKIDDGGRDGAPKPVAEHPPVVSPRVEKGVLHFRTRDKASPAGGPEELIEAEWNFTVVGKDDGQLRVRVPRLEAERAQGKDVPPPPPALPMKRVPR